MECNKLRSGKGFLKIRAKVTGFLTAKIEKRNTPEQVIVTKKRNIISTTGLQSLLNAFQTYMSGVNYVGETAVATGIIITTSSGQQVVLSFPNPPTVSVTNNSAILTFTATDDSLNSYSTASEQLITSSAQFNIPIATASLSLTKNSNEILRLTWVITISISQLNDIVYIQTPTPQYGGIYCVGSNGVCVLCVESSSNSQYSSSNGFCGTSQLSGLSGKYTETNFVTTQLFTDMFYNNYRAGSTNSFTYVTGTTLVIYTPYCLPYFMVGANSFTTSNPNNESACWEGNGENAGEFTPIYLQVHFPSETEPYIGVQIEFTT